MTVFCYLAVEGPHDVAVVGRVLTQHGARIVQQIAALPAEWQPLVPKAYPAGGDLLRRMPVPQFYSDGNRHVAVHACGGESRLVETACDSWEQVPQLTSIGVLGDADAAAPADVFKKLRTQLEAYQPSASALVGKKLVVGSGHSGAPAADVFVFPDGRRRGTVEHLLLDCARVVYPRGWNRARRYVRSARRLAAKERSEISKPAGVDKATLAAMSAVMKPGKAIQMTVQDHDWICRHTKNVPSVAALTAFLHGLGAIDCASARCWPAPKLKAPVR